MPDRSIPHYRWKGRNGNAPMIREPTGEGSWAPGRLLNGFRVNRQSALLLSGLASPGCRRVCLRVATTSLVYVAHQLAFDN